MTVLDQNLPFICRVLKLVQVECNQIIEEEALHLAAEDVKFRT